MRTSEPIQRRPHASSRMQTVLEVAGGIIVIHITSMVIIRLFYGLIGAGGFGAGFMLEAAWLLTVLAVIPFFPLGIRYEISLRTTLLGVAMGAPELALTIFNMQWAMQYDWAYGIAMPLALAIAVGAAEEFFFRVLLLGWLVTRVNVLAALFISSLVFALAHVSTGWTFDNMFNTLPQFSGGLLYGAIYLRTRNILGPIILHAIWDLPFFLVIGSGDSVEPTIYPLMPALEVVKWTVVCAYALWLVAPVVHDQSLRAARRLGAATDAEPVAAAGAAPPVMTAAAPMVVTAAEPVAVIPVQAPVAAAAAPTDAVAAEPADIARAAPSMPPPIPVRTHTATTLTPRQPPSPAAPQQPAAAAGVPVGEPVSQPAWMPDRPSLARRRFVSRSATRPTSPDPPSTVSAEAVQRHRLALPSLRLGQSPALDAERDTSHRH